MGLFDFFRRQDRPADHGQHEHPALHPDEAAHQIRAALDQALGRTQDPSTPDPHVAELRSRAAQLHDQITNAMRRENTPANAAGYDVADHVMLGDLRPGPTSTELQDDLALLILSRPEAFTGT